MIIPIIAPRTMPIFTVILSQYKRYKPVKNVNAAAHLKYHKAFGTSF